MCLHLLSTEVNCRFFFFFSKHMWGHQSFRNCTDVFIEWNHWIWSVWKCKCAPSQTSFTGVVVTHCFLLLLTILTNRGFTVANAGVAGSDGVCTALVWRVCPLLQHHAGSADINRFPLHSYFMVSQQCFTKTGSWVYIKCLYKTQSMSRLPAGCSIIWHC